MNIATWLHQTSRTWPRRPAIYDGATLTADYGTLGRRCGALAWSLSRRHGVGVGDRVAVFASNCPEYLEILHAIWWLGAVAVPINHKLHPSEAGWIEGDSGATLTLTDSSEKPGPAPRLVIGTREYLDMLEGGVIDAPAEVSRDALAWLFYTSGTTGKPKGVMLTHDNLLHMSLCYGLDVDQPSHRQVALYAAPMSHGAGLYSFPFIRAAAAHLIPQSRGFDPGEILNLAGEPGNLCFFAAPTMIKRLIARAKEVGHDGSGIRTIIYGGGPMYAADIDAALAQFGPRFVQIYGQGESPMTITALSRELVADQTHPNWRRRRDSVGVAQSAVQVAVLGEDLVPLEHGAVGEVAVRGPTVMRGYWRNEAATTATVRDGWLLTGDLGVMDEDGFVTLTDRSKDVVISGGSNIYPREVEEVLLRHPSISEAAVVGVPEAEWGEEVVAFVVTVPGTACGKDELDSWCRAHMASFKKPKRYFFADELPKNSYGKVLKKDLRDRLAGGNAAKI